MQSITGNGFKNVTYTRSGQELIDYIVQLSGDVVGLQMTARGALKLLGVVKQPHLELLPVFLGPRVI